MILPMERVRPPLVTFTGIDGAGKSTQIRLLRDELERLGIPTRYLWSRGGYTTGFETLKTWLRRNVPGALPAPGHSPARERCLKRPGVRRLWLSLAILDLIRVYGLQVRCWRASGYVVICDRYLWDTLVDFRMNFPEVTVERWLIWRLLERVAPKPSYAWFLDIPLEESECRSVEKGDPYPDALDVRMRRHALYTDLAQAPRLWRIVDATQPAIDVAAEISAAMLSRYERSE
jgi:thymidylate kinase